MPMGIVFLLIVHHIQGFSQMTTVNQTYVQLHSIRQLLDTGAVVNLVINRQYLYGIMVRTELLANAEHTQDFRMMEYVVINVTR